MIRQTLTAFVLSACALAACSSVDKQTQITVALSSETEIPKELDSFTIRVISTRTGEIRFLQEYEPQSGREFPTTLAVIPVDESSLGSPLRVELEGRKNGVIFLQRTSIISYFKDRNILLTLPLRMACFQFKDCGPDSTCQGGQCVSAKTDAQTLPTYDPKYVFGDQGACFDEQTCLATDAVEVKVGDDCTFALPPRLAEGQGNVAVRWAAAPERVLGLDSGDTQEGWTRISADRARLSQGACDSHFQRKDSSGRLLVTDWAKTVYVAPTCASKTALVPSCFSLRTQHAGIGAIMP